MHFQFTHPWLLLLAPDAGTFAGGEELFDERLSAPLPLPRPFHVTLMAGLSQLRHAVWHPRAARPAAATDGEEPAKPTPERDS
jgi:hypothetical protein